MNINREVFIRTNDPTGYKYATEHFEGGWTSFKQAMKSKKFEEEFKELEDELLAKIKSDMIVGLQDISMRNATAARILMGLTDNVAPVGRPKEFKKEYELALQHSHDESYYIDDIKRLRSPERK